MRFLFIAVLIASNFKALCQKTQFDVFLNDTKIGTYHESQETATYVTTFTKLKIAFAKELDTIQFAQESIWTQDTLGNLLSVRTERVFQDSLEWYRQFPLDTSSIDSLKTRILGPYGIREKAKLMLDSLGKSISFQTYVPDLDTIASISWEVRNYSIEEAQKLTHISESFSGQVFALTKRNREFHFVGSNIPTQFGALVIRPATKPLATWSYLEKNGIPEFILTNTLLPDPENINAVNLKITVGDSVRELTLTDNSFEPLPRHATELKPFVNFNHWVRPLDSTWVSHIFPIAINRMANYAKIDRVIQLMDSLGLKDSEKNITLIRISRYLDLPSCLTFGLIYQNGAWVPHTWVKIGIDEEWIAFDPILNQKTNSALRIPLKLSALQHGINGLYTGEIVQLEDTKIEITEFLLNKRPIRSKDKNGRFVEWKHKRYINHALGVSFDIPEGFAVDTLGADLSRSSVLRLTNPKREYFEVIQMVDIGKLDLEENLKLWTQSENSFKEESNGVFSIYGIGKKAIVLEQGSSFLVIKINAEDAEQIGKSLLKKNLEVKF